MEISGERYQPKINVPEHAYEHWHRYMYASQFVAGKSVLDIACGEGYGSQFLSASASYVLGVDISEAVIQYASSRYLRPNLEFRRGSVDAIPVDGQALFDVVVCFETIEHVDTASQLRFLEEVRRVLKPDGVLLISTPNRLYYSDEPIYKNEYHVKEFYPSEFTSFLQTVFTHITILGQHIYPGSYVWPVNSTSSDLREYQLAFHRDEFVPSNRDEKKALYLLAVCSNQSLEHVAASILIDIDEQAIAQRAQHIIDKGRHIENLGMIIENKNDHVSHLEAEVVKREHQIVEYVQIVRNRETHIAEQDRVIAQHVSNIQALELRSGRNNEHSDTKLNAAYAQIEALKRELAAERVGIAYQLISRSRRLFASLFPPKSLQKAVYVRARRLIKRRFGPSFSAKVAYGVRLPRTLDMRSSDPVYDHWLQANVPSVEELKQQRLASDQLKLKPLISIVVPVYNIPAELLKQCVQSVLAQSYPNWELCIVDDCSTQAHVRPLLKQLGKSDRRIRVEYAQKNGGIAVASNACVAMAQGDFVTFLDNDDEFAPHALFTIAELLSRLPETDLIYSDEDKLTSNDTREHPYFKPDYSPDLLLSNNYICHMLVLRRSLLTEIGGFRSGYDGAQDYDLVLRAIEQTERHKIQHIPDVLYHWRMIDGSTATSYHSKPKALTATLNLLDEHLVRTLGTGYGAIEAARASETAIVYHPRYALQNEPLVSIVIGTKDKVDILKACVTSLSLSTYTNYEIVIIDNNSREAATFAYFAELAQHHPKVRVIAYPQPFNYSAVNNFGVREARGEMIVLLNNDTEIITPDWLEIMLGYIQQERVGAVGVELLYPNKTIQHAGVIIGLGGVAGHSHKYFPEDSPGYCNLLRTVRNYSAVTAACIMFRRTVWEEVSGLNEQLVVTFNDVDFCLKIGAAGYDIVYTPQVRLWHHESVSVGRVHLNERRMDPFEINYMKEHWPNIIVGDPFYSPNLTLDTENYAIHPGRRRALPSGSIETMNPENRFELLRKVQ